MLHLASFFLDHWLWHPLVGRGYQFWSGPEGSIPQVAIIGGVWAGYRKINCHAKGCPRIGHYAVEGTPYKVCRYHHPKVPNEGVTGKHIRDAHRIATQDLREKRKNGEA